MFLTVYGFYFTYLDEESSITVFDILQNIVLHIVLCFHNLVEYENFVLWATKKICKSNLLFIFHFEKYFLVMILNIYIHFSLFSRYAAPNAK